MQTTIIVSPGAPANVRWFFIKAFADPLGHFDYTRDVGGGMLLREVVGPDIHLSSGEEYHEPVFDNVRLSLQWRVQQQIIYQHNGEPAENDSWSDTFDSESQLFLSHKTFGGPVLKDYTNSDRFYRIDLLQIIRGLDDVLLRADVSNETIFSAESNSAIKLALINTCLDAVEGDAHQMEKVLGKRLVLKTKRERSAIRGRNYKPALSVVDECRTCDVRAEIIGTTFAKRVANPLVARRLILNMEYMGGLTYVNIGIDHLIAGLV